jgi:hypothetical protein
MLLISEILRSSQKKFPEYSVIIKYLSNGWFRDDLVAKIEIYASIRIP